MGDGVSALSEHKLSLFPFPAEHADSIIEKISKKINISFFISHNSFLELIIG